MSTDAFNLTYNPNPIVEQIKKEYAARRASGVQGRTSLGLHRPSATLSNPQGVENQAIGNSSQTTITNNLKTPQEFESKPSERVSYQSRASSTLPAGVLGNITNRISQLDNIKTSTLAANSYSVLPSETNKNVTGVSSASGFTSLNSKLQPERTLEKLSNYYSPPNPRFTPVTPSNAANATKLVGVATSYTSNYSNVQGKLFFLYFVTYFYNPI